MEHRREQASVFTGTFVLVSNVRICALVLVSEQREATTVGLAVGTQKSYQHYQLTAAYTNSSRPHTLEAEGLIH